MEVERSFGTARGCFAISEATKHIIEQVLLLQKGGKDGLKSNLIREDIGNVEVVEGVLHCGLQVQVFHSNTQTSAKGQSLNGASYLPTLSLTLVLRSPPLLPIPSRFISSSPFSPFVILISLGPKSISNVGNLNLQGVEFPLAFPKQKFKEVSFHKSPPIDSTWKKFPMRSQPLEPPHSSEEGFHVKGFPLMK